SAPRNGVAGLTLSRPLDVRRQCWPTAKLAERTVPVLDDAGTRSPAAAACQACPGATSSAPPVLQHGENRRDNSHELLPPKLPLWVEFLACRPRSVPDRKGMAHTRTRLIASGAPCFQRQPASCALKATHCDDPFGQRRDSPRARFTPNQATLWLEHCAQ